LTSGGEGGIIESERQVSSDRYAVPKGLTESRAFRSKFNEMTDDLSLQREYHQAAKEILSHRSGNNGEDLYFYNIKSGNWTKSTSGTTAGSPEYTPEIVKAIEKSDIGDLVAFHNHPAGMPPSAGDFNAAYENGYKVGYTIGHNGRIFEYTAPKEKIPEGIYNLRIAKYKSEKLSEYEAQLRTLEDLKSLFGFEFRESYGKMSIGKK